MEHESHPHHHAHGTGLRWLDVTLGVAATVVSLVSLWLGLHSAHSMEKLVAANSYPYLALERSTADMSAPVGADHYRGRVEYALRNNGVGPARVEWVQLTYQGKPMANLSELLAACCGPGPHAVNGLDHRGNVAGLVRAGDALTLFSWTEPATPNPTFAGLHHAMRAIQFTACYCSVFDECYLASSNGAKPREQRVCTPPAKPFQPAFAGED